MKNSNLRAETLKKLQEQYLAKLIIRLKEIDEALEKKDMTVIYNHFHQLKGSGQIYGFDFITTIGMAVIFQMKQGAPQDKVISLVRAGLSLIKNNQERMASQSPLIIEGTPDYALIISALPPDPEKGS